MKQLYLSAILVASIIGHAQARIGFTLDQCRKAYGKEVKTEAAWTSSSQKAYGFVSNNLYVYAILSSEAKVVDIVYFDNNTKAELLPSLKAKLWDLNVDKGRVWDDHYYLTKSWDGKHEYKKLGEEHFKHYLMYETNGPSALVENANKLGWQIRDLQQFNLEQRVIKQMAAR